MKKMFDFLVIIMNQYQKKQYKIQSSYIYNNNGTKHYKRMFFIYQQGIE